MRAQAATDKNKSGGPLRAMIDVINTEGVSGLYRGLNSTLFTLFAANFIYFYAFHLLRAFVGRNKAMRKIGKVQLHRERERVCVFVFVCSYSLHIQTPHTFVVFTCVNVCISVQHLSNRP
jgi:hypothetical protein